MSTTKRGLDVLIKIGSQAIGGQKSASIEMSTDSIDVSNKVTGEWVQKIPGFKQWSMTCDGLYISDDEGYAALMTAFKNSTPVQVIFADENATISQSGNAIVSSMSLDAPYDDALTYAVSFEGVGALTDNSMI